MTLSFDAAAHRYSWNGAPVPNVTRALSMLVDFSKIPASTLETARQEGVAIHKTVELYAKDDLDEASLPEWLKPRLAAYKKFVADTGFAVIASEQRLYHTVYQYAGTADLFGTMREGKSVVEVNIDVKRSLFNGRVIGLQTAAYAEQWKEMTGARGLRRYALVLKPDGTYKLEPFTDKRDLGLFLACLSVHKFKEQIA